MASSTDGDVRIAVALYLLSESGEKKSKRWFPSDAINKEREEAEGKTISTTLRRPG